MTIKEFERRADYQNGADREFGRWKVIDIHQIPQRFTDTDEVDFYCSNGKQVFLLRFRDRNKELFERIDARSPNELTYLIAEMPIRRLDDKCILETLKRFSLE